MAKMIVTVRYGDNEVCCVVMGKVAYLKLALDIERGKTVTVTNDVRRTTTIPGGSVRSIESAPHRA